MQHLLFSFSNKPAVPKTSSWYWRRGIKNVASICLITREHLKASLSANDLILMCWPKLSTVVITGASHPILSFCWVSAIQSLLPHSGKTLDFLFRPCIWGGKNLTQPNPKKNQPPIGKSLYMILLQVAFLCKSSDRGKDLKECELLAAPQLSPIPISPSPVPHFFDCGESTAVYILCHALKCLRWAVLVLKRLMAT